MQYGGLILCGGESKRMGVPKPWLPFGEQTLLARVATTLSGVVHPLVVVGAAGQKLPPLPADVVVCHDREPARGPLEGIAVGLAALESRVPAAFLCACDAALLSPAVIRALCDSLGEYDAVVPIVAGRRQPLVSAVRTSLWPAAEAMLAAGVRKTHQLFDRFATRFITDDELRAVDPELTALCAMNTPAEYLSALAIAGFKAPDEARLRMLFPSLS